MEFRSAVFRNQDADSTILPSNPPQFFSDLNLDQVVDSLTKGKEEYDLSGLCYLPLGDVDAIEYRHEVFRDLEDGELLQAFRSYAEGMRSVRDHLAQSERLYYQLQKEWWFLQAVRIYCGTVGTLAEHLRELEPSSRALVGFRVYLAEYTVSEEYLRLRKMAERLAQELSSIRYTLLINDSSITVRRFDSETDYAAEVRRTFERFSQGSAKDYSVKFTESTDMNHVEAAVLDRVALLYPAVFGDLAELRNSQPDFLDDTLKRFDQEIHFYFACIDLMASLKELGLRFCLPTIETHRKEVSSVEGFDLALALKLRRNGSGVVTNDFYLTGSERIIVVSGPNQGGKTTFARAFGQLHYLSALGCPVPGSEARLFLFDKLFTHFEQEEDIVNLRGKLHDDLARVREVLSQATARSIIILNEIFSSTTLSDEVFLSRQILERIIETDCLCVCVTFIDELSVLSDKTVSMVSTVVPDNPAERTFKVRREPADGLAYAMAIARKHGLTYDELIRRVGS